MTARVILSCADHPHYARCDDDEWFLVETVAAARALHAASHPGATSAKVAAIAINCDNGGCTLRVIVRADTATEAREVISHHNAGWYTARRAGRVIDSCQIHLGTCCVHHARLDMPTLDRSAILPGETGAPAQLDLFVGPGAP